MLSTPPVTRSRMVQGVEVPTFFYGTAWKEDRTTSLVQQALHAGFRGIDTANQRRHYHEAAVGIAVREALERGDVGREQLFLQSKFTYRESQDRRLPYDATADLASQVRQSFASSLDHLWVEVLDAYLLHGPRGRGGLSADDRKVWRAMEGLLYQGKVRLIGASNTNARQLEELCSMAEVRPAFVQNRCFARAGWDRDVRRICDDLGIVYQGFSLLTANHAELRRREVARIATAHQRTVPQIVFLFVLQQGMVCLTGTGDPAHMREDLAVYDFELESDEVEVLEGIAGTGRRLGW